MKFEIGEIAIICKCYERPYLVGKEVEIIGLATGGNGDYRIHIPDFDPPGPFDCWTCWETDLRKKKPPEELSTWEEFHKVTGWKPETVT